MEGKSPEAIRGALGEKAIHASVSPRAYTLFDMDKRDLDAVVRASVHYYNTMAEVERFCSAVEDLV
jgi:selenocysteine lyase/cysteine desulfurase